MVKKVLELLFLSLFFVLVLFSSTDKILAKDKVTVHFFWGQGCPHCAQEKVFLKSLEAEYPQVEVKDYEVTGSRENSLLLEKLGQKLSVDVSGVPFTVVGEHYTIGFLNAETTGREIESYVLCVLENGCSDVVADLTVVDEKQIQLDRIKNFPDKISLPFMGEVKVSSLSLPALTFIIALLDGFNPCAMWVLLFLISLLLGMQDRRRMWLLGIVFIMASSFVYFLFMSAWLNLFLFLGFIGWVRLGVGLLALGAGAYYLRDFLVNKSGGCQVVGEEKRKKMFEKIKAVTQEKKFWLALLGMVVLAFAVNLIELICSAGLPAIYTQILSLSDLPAWHYYLYLAFYILIFMLDDLFIFFTAMITLKATGVQSKYARYSHLVGGFLMFIIGLLLLFKPEILMFG
jgi:thiol-disulfide isomerase/thioredoxin